ATARRLAGALAGAAAMFVVGLPLIPLGEHVGWWHFAIPWEPNFLSALWINSALCAFAFLITWRIARRFGGRGVGRGAVVAGVIGPIRDKGFVERFPDWGSFAPGVAPVLAISGSYVLMGAVGHGVMWLVAGPARGSPLARRPWEAAESSTPTEGGRELSF